MEDRMRTSNMPNQSSRRKEKRECREAILEEIMSKYFPELINDINSQIQEAEQISR